MKILLALLFLTIGLKAQAVYNNFSPIVKGVTIGTTHCYFWFHSAVASPPYDIEIACYSPSQTNVIAALPSNITQGSFPFSNGIITWLMTYSGSSIIATFTGVALTGDTTELSVTATI